MGLAMEAGAIAIGVMGTTAVTLQQLEAVVNGRIEARRIEAEGAGRCAR